MDTESIRRSAADIGRVGASLVLDLVAVAKEKLAMFLAFLLTPIGRTLGTFGILFIAWFAFAKHYENKGASRVVAQLEKKAETNAKKAETARRSVDRIPDERLRDRYFRD